MTNPWIGKVAECVVMGSSGQPIEDIIKATDATDISPLEWLERTLFWKHMCPTAPDTLPVQPYSAKDPFIINHCPDIYFVGNTDKFETKLWKGKYKLKCDTITFVVATVKALAHYIFFYSLMLRFLRFAFIIYNGIIYYL